MSALFLFSFVLLYFLVLLAVAYRTSRNATNESFFIGNRNSNWMLVAFGMIGTSLSGVTFVSVPGTVGDFAGEGYKGFGYFQVVIGYWLGYFLIAAILLPLYYRLGLTSIYLYLKTRFGTLAYKTGALFFLISRTVGATARLYLVINVLQVFILDQLGLPFWLSTLIILLMILLYTFEGGVKTIVYTDTLQTTFMLLGLAICIFYILQHLGLSLSTAMHSLTSQGYDHVFNGDVRSKGFFLKQVVGGMFITVAMTGLDQEMMQKNISVKTLRDSRKNMISFSFVLLLVNFLFLFLGGLLYTFMLKEGAHYQGHQLNLAGRSMIGDDIFPIVALHYLPKAISLIFVIALISALFPSADGALTALTSSFCIDILGLQRDTRHPEAKKVKMRQMAHLAFAALFFLCILLFKWINNKSIVSLILELAGYTYGPLLGLFAFGIFTRRQLKSTPWLMVICLAAPLACFLLSQQSPRLFSGYQIGLELLLINGLLTFGSLYLISEKPLPTN